MKNTIILCSPTSEDMRENLSLGQKGMFFPPLGLLLVAQSLKDEGFEVKFYDGNFDIEYQSEIKKFIQSDPNKILFVGFYLALLQVKDCINIINLVKDLDTSIPIIIGGPFPSAFSNIVLKSNLVDAVCTGDGAESIKVIAKNISTGKTLENIPNILVKDNISVAECAQEQRDNLNGNNLTYYENFMDLEAYVNNFDIYLTRKFDPEIKRAIPILTGLGCSYKCAFCENALLGHKHISLSAENIIKQVTYYQEKFNIDTFAFFDEDFFLDRKRLFQLLDLIEEKGLKFKWGTQCRANYFNSNYINETVIERLENCGCVRLSMGIESGSPSMLRKIKKGITTKQVITAAQYAKNSSIYFSYSFIIYLPEETRRDFDCTFDLIEKLLSIKKNSFVSAIHNYFAYPGTPLAIETEKEHGINIEDLFKFEQFSDLSLNEYNKLINPQKQDAYRDCRIYYYQKLRIPFQKNFSLWAIYFNLTRVIGMLRRKIGFYHIPVEIYLRNIMRKFFNKLNSSLFKRKDS